MRAGSRVTWPAMLASKTRRGGLRPRVGVKNEVEGRSEGLGGKDEVGARVGSPMTWRSKRRAGRCRARRT